MDLIILNIPFYSLPKKFKMLNY